MNVYTFGNNKNITTKPIFVLNNPGEDNKCDFMKLLSSIYFHQNLGWVRDHSNNDLRMTNVMWDFPNLAYYTNTDMKNLIKLSNTEFIKIIQKRQGSLNVRNDMFIFITLSKPFNLFTNNDNFIQLEWLQTKNWYKHIPNLRNTLYHYLNTEIRNFSL